MNKDPKISVLLPVYNGELYLREAIDSILNQTFQDFEFIIIDDGSTDESANIIRSYDNEKIIFFEQGENKGLISSLNKGLALARAPLIARMDADDISLPERLAFQRTWLHEHPEVDVLGTGRRFIDTDGNLSVRVACAHAEHKQIIECILHSKKGTVLSHPTVMMRKAIVLQVGGYNEHFPVCEDMDLWLRVADFGNLHVISNPLLHYRRHKRSVSVTSRSTQLISGILARVCYYLRQQGLPDPSVGSYESWTALNGLVVGKIEEHQLLEADRARSTISDVVFEAWGWHKYVKLALLIISKPELIIGLYARRKLKYVINETVRKMEQAHADTSL